jgi:hypothetical protein
MNILQTDLNEQLAKSIGRRLAADRFLNFGRVSFWYLAGVGLICFGVGSSVGFGFYGYSYVVRHGEELTILSSILSKSLSKVQFHAMAEGVVQLDPHEVTLAGGQAISMASDARVSLDRSATVLANGEIKIDLPSVTTPPIASARTLAKAPLVTNFTVFKRVPFDKGAIMTGWVFLTSAQASPTHQYCYYTANLETPGFDITIDIGDNGELTPPKKLPSGFDISAAFNRCVWFKDN